MTDLPIDYVARVAPNYGIKDGRIVPSSSQFREVRPLELQTRPPLYARFAALFRGATDELVDFIAAFGPLTHEGELHGERIDELANMSGRLSAMIGWSNTNPQALFALEAISPGRRAVIRHSWDSVIERVNQEGGLADDVRTNGDLPRIPSAAANIVGKLRPGVPDGRPVLALAPDTLWDALLLQFYLAISHGARVKACDWCGGPMETGGSGKRSNARFCSDICRLHHHRAQRGGAK